MRFKLGAGLLLVALWAGGVWAFLGTLETWARVALVVAGLPLIGLWLEGERSPSWRREAFGLSTPLALLWVLYHPALTSWWIRDDPCHLVKILEFGLWRPFVSAIGGFLTPWLNLSLGTDFVLFGLEPTAFYLHQLLAFSVLIFAGYGFSRAYLTPAASSLAMALFVASVPSFAVVRLLMNRHYLEGLILALASLALYRWSVQKECLPWAILGAAVYLLATTTKEVFVPLILLLPFFARGDWLAGGGWRRQWRYGLPFVVAAGLYSLWRLYMLGWSNNLSGYGALGGEFRLEALARVPALLGLNRPWQIGLAIVVLLVVAIGLRRRVPDAWLMLGVGILALGAPLIPVAARLEPRHFFLPAFVFGLILAAALAAPSSRLEILKEGHQIALRALAAVLLLVWALASLTGSYFWHRFEPAITHHRAEGSFVLDDSRDGLLMTTVNHSTFLECLARLRREVLSRPGGPGFCGDACFCAEQLPSEKRWRYSQGRIVDAEPPSPGCDEDRKLDVELSHDRRAHRMFWSFGPYDEGSYEVLLISGIETPGISIPVALPRQGSMPYWLSGPLRFVVKHRSPDGRLTYSQNYVVEPDGEAVEP